jgi:hypothetical protein
MGLKNICFLRRSFIDTKKEWTKNLARRIHCTRSFSRAVLLLCITVYNARITFLKTVYDNAVGNVRILDPRNWVPKFLVNSDFIRFTITQLRYRT